MPAWVRRIERWVRGAPRVVYHPEYRLPLVAFSSQSGFDCRRADMAVDALIEMGVLHEEDPLVPEAIGWKELALVHDAAWLEALTSPEGIAPVYALNPAEVPHPGLLDGIRRATGGTLLAARTAIGSKGAVCNLLGGFHHARPDAGAGYCPVNDVAVAVAVLRSEGFAGKVNVLDLDAHPPDGIAACLGGTAWIGSLSGAAWTAPEGVDEEALPRGADDATCLDALDRLLSRMPAAELTFVLAGNDVLAGDTHGQLGMSLPGVRERDRRVHHRLGETAAVWLPAGGYHPDAWRLLAGSVLVLAGHRELAIPAQLDPIRAHSRRIARTLPTAALGGEITLTATDLDDALGLPPSGPPRLLGFYTAAGVELALQRYGLLDAVRWLGYRDLRVDVDATDVGDRFRCFGRAGEPAGEEREHLLTEVVLARSVMEGESFLFVHWLTLRHPLGVVTAGRPLLPGQDAPGLGLARDVFELFDRMAERLDLAGVAMRPAWLHVAWAVRGWMECAAPAEGAQLDALYAEHGGMALPELSRKAAEGALTLAGAPFRWGAPLMVRRRRRD